MSRAMDNLMQDIGNGSGSAPPRDYTLKSLYTSGFSLHSIHGARAVLEIADAYFKGEGLDLRAHKAKGLMTSRTHFCITASDGSTWFFKTTSPAGVKQSDGPAS